jgi:transposase
MEANRCPGCLEREAVIADLQARLAALEAEVRELRARLGQNASNSSVPPSANPPQAPKPVVKKPSGRPPGGQRNHPPAQRRRLPPERLHETIAYIPKTCGHCQAALPEQAGPHDPPPRWHQVAEVPRAPVVVVEHQSHARTCPCCGVVTWEPLPPEVSAHAFGPRLTATVAYLSGSPHVSKRGIEEIVETVLGVPIALGTVANLEQEVSAALAPAHTEALEAVREAAVKNVDETSWKQAGKKCWLWGAVTALAAGFVIHPSRGLKGLAALLGEKIKGILGSDRWSAYGRLLVECRQLCWAHLKRDFQKCVDRGSPGEGVGQAGLTIVQRLFEQWHLFRGGGCDRAMLQERMQPIRVELRSILEAGAGCADTKTAAFCANVLALEPALWTFVRAEGVDPTNNRAERILRSGVLWRKSAFGCHSAAGCRFVERILTVTQTLRLQQRPVLDYLHEAMVAHRAGLPTPKLLPD